jgi:large subunit ribosomal protein L16
MAMMPRRVKYRKFQRGKNRGIAVRGSQLNFGEFGLKAIDNGIIKNNQIEAVRVLLARRFQGSGKVWFRVFPHKSVTKKPAETRMGKGKGDLAFWVALVKRGAVVVEVSGIPESLAKTAFRLAAFKLPVRTKFVSRASTV